MKKTSLFKIIFLVSFFTVFITVSVIGSMGLFKFDSVKSLDAPKDFSAGFSETENGYVFNLVNGREALYTNVGAVGVRFNDGENAGETSYVHYSTVDEVEGGYKAQAIVTGAKGSVIKITDYYAVRDCGVDVTRTMDVVTVGAEKGFTTEFPIFTQNDETISENDWFNPSQFYVSGTHSFITTNARTAMSSKTGEFIISSNNTSALVLSKFKNGYVTTMTDTSHSQLVTTYEDTANIITRSDDSLVIDESISITGIAYGDYTDEKTLAKQVKMAFCYPSHEVLSADGGTAWRLLPVEENLSRTVSFKIDIEAEDDFYSMVENSWRNAYADTAITDKRYKQEDVYTTLLESMKRSYSEDGAWGVPMYMTNAEDYQYNSGFLYRNADIALLMYKAGYRKIEDKSKYNPQSEDNPIYIEQAVKVLEDQISTDKIDKNIYWGAGMEYKEIYYRTRYEGLATVLDLYDFFKSTKINHTGVLSQQNLKNYLLGKAELYKNETSVMGLIFYTKLWKYAEAFNVDYSQTAIRLLDKVAVENRFFDGYFGSVEHNDPNAYIGVAEDAMIILNAYLNAYEATGATRYLDLAKNCATWLETFNMLSPMNLNLKGDDGSKPYNSSFIGNERFLAYGYNFNNTRHFILDCPTVSSAIDFEKLYNVTGDEHYLDFAQRLVYNSSLYVNMGDKVGLMDDPLNSSGDGFINEFVSNTFGGETFFDGGIRGAAHTSNIGWCGYQLMYVYDKLAENGDSPLAKVVFEENRNYNLAKYKLVSYDSAKIANFNYSPEKAVDGKQNTYWATGASYMVIDLNELCRITNISLDSLNSTSAKVKVYLSTDGKEYKALSELDFANQNTVALSCTKIARYVKIETNSNEKITEITVTGCPEYYQTLSYGATATGAGNYTACLDRLKDTSYTLNGGYYASNYNTAWSVTGTQTLTLNLGEVKTVAQFVLMFENEWTYQDEYKLANGDTPTQEGYALPEAHTYKIEIAGEDGVFYDYAVVDGEIRSVYVHEQTVNCKYVRLTVQAGSETVNLQDFKVMGCSVL